MVCCFVYCISCCALLFGFEVCVCFTVSAESSAAKQFAESLPKEDLPRVSMTLQYWVHDPFILGNDHFFWGQKESPGVGEPPSSWEALVEATWTEDPWELCSRNPRNTPSGAYWEMPTPCKVATLLQGSLKDLHFLQPFETCGFFNKIRLETTIYKLHCSGV